MDRRSVKSSNRSVLDRMAEVEAEYAAHKLRQEAKDREFADLLRSIESPPEKAAAVVADAKAGLADAGRNDEQKIRTLKEERESEIATMTSTLEYAERICSTFRTLELNSSAGELDQWCEDCGCIHTIDVVKSD